MTEPFRVPEPSEAATQSAINAWQGVNDHLRGARRQLHAAYAVDLPTIVRAEVERALVEQSLATGAHPSIRDWREKYLAARFGAVAPEIPQPKMGEVLHTCTMGPNYPQHPTFVAPAPSAPAEPQEYHGSGCRVFRKSPVSGCVETKVSGVEGVRGQWTCIEFSPGMTTPENLRAAADALEGAAGVRPEAGKPITRRELIDGARAVREKAEARRNKTEPESCTACPCARCAAEREFVRALAEREHGRSPYYGLVWDAADRLLGAK